MGRRLRRDRELNGERGIEPSYEGLEVLSTLLARSGCAHDADGVIERFRLAHAAGESRSDVIPALFSEEPRFASPDDARRLYANLFGLWDRIASGATISKEVAATQGVLAPLPPRGGARGVQLTNSIVEAVWKHLDALSVRGRRRWRDRFEGAQPDLVAWVEALPLPGEVVLAACDLAFETWAMFDVAFGDRAGRVHYRELRALEAEPPPLEATQPALAWYVAEALDLLAEEDPSFGATARAQVERAVAAVASTLANALAPEEEDG